MRHAKKSTNRDFRITFMEVSEAVEEQQPEDEEAEEEAEKGSEEGSQVCSLPSSMEYTDGNRCAMYPSWASIAASCAVAYQCSYTVLTA